MFKRWCTQQKFNNATNLSHVLMDGGVLSVPFDKLNEFHEKYIEAVRSGEKLFVVEQKSPQYNFFVDIDYKDTRSLTFDEIHDICKVICDKVKRHGGKDCLISVSPPKMAGQYTKTGVHLNWPGFVVDQRSAIALREHILVALSRAKGGTDWNEIIDVAVYGDIRRKSKGSGFRMPWSHKMAKHTPCGGQGCPECGGKGKIVQVAYLPLFMYNHGPLSKLTKIDPEPNLDILKMSSIRTDQPQHITVEPPSSVIKEGSFTEAQTKDEIENDELKGLIEDFIQRNLEGQSTAVVTKLFKHKETYLVSTNSKYCENLRRAHSSNHVWFHISGQVIAQKCFCRCETIRGRRDGFCKDFYGRKHTLPPRVVEKLYPKREDLKKCPEIKKFEEKPQIKQSDVKQPLESFIRRCMKCPEDTRVVSIARQKNGFTALTTSSYCETIGGDHQDCTMSYVIRDGKITQKCPVCTKSTARTHDLSGSVKEALKKNNTQQ
ncbi:hypothetical protein OtV5_077 [Ostreococcus tauri virus OtV5]|uniref:C962R-like N-terminal AEP domain-containing protein n=1 Tax=Ostreococcus tauri virus OtV5 TaxID=1785753 RepID=A9YVY4_9PHYC|nr:hypothetical protein OtV5_077 [Ostreococcus tauri virus OtV5]ABY27867.1 hypothetical protein OtV5_077 [Ostreococcus tauri virus OtV5]